MDFYKQGSEFALQQLKLAEQPSSSPVPQGSQSKPITSTTTQGRTSATPTKPFGWGLGGTAPAGFQSIPQQPAPGSGPFPTTQIGKGSIPSSPSTQPGVTGANIPSAKPQDVPGQLPAGSIPGANPFR